MLIQERTKLFSLEIIKLSHILKKTGNVVIGHQILKSGTSIGANISEATGAESKKDFLHKIFIAYKEAQETKYWLELIELSVYIIKDKKQLKFYNEEIVVILKILNKIIHKLKNSNN